MDNIINYNVSVHATNLRSKIKIAQALQYLLTTPINLSILQKFEIKTVTVPILNVPEHSERAQKLLNHINRLEKSENLDGMALEVHEENYSGMDPELDEEVARVMGQEENEPGPEVGDVEQRPSARMYTEQCQDSPRQAAERRNLWATILEQERGEPKTPSPSPRPFGGDIKICETPRFNPINRQNRHIRGKYRPISMFGLFKDSV
ncbi:unnamed protein product [Caenorhabditis sp. 36 PRJEB53466]|nr:unnamed protein product [Caenorhabditis sp. 36 PRJEB53466]